MIKLVPLCIGILLSTFIVSCLCSADISYRLGGSKQGGHAAISEEDSYHGSHSAKLTADPVQNGKSKFARVYVTFKDPVTVDDLDQLSLWTKPAENTGHLELELFLKGENGKNVDIKTEGQSWEDLGLSPGTWDELDAFDLKYKSGKEDGLTLDDCKKEFQGMQLVKLYITLYGISRGSGESTAYIDRIKLGDSKTISFESLDNSPILKGSGQASPGGTINYVITYGNILDEPADVIVKENYDPKSVFIESNKAPDSGTDDFWTIRRLPPGEYGQIKIKMKADKPNSKGKITSNVSGSGYVTARGRLSTVQDSYQITNQVTILIKNITLSQSATTTVKAVEGSTMTFGQHGSGIYKSEESLEYSESRLSAVKGIDGIQTPIVANISGNTLNFNNKWHADDSCERLYKEAPLLLSERYLYANTLNLSSSMWIKNNPVSSKYNTEAELKSRARFTGLAEFKTNVMYAQTSQWFAGSFSKKTDQNISYYSVHKTAPTINKGWLDCCPLIGQADEYLGEVLTYDPVYLNYPENTSASDDQNELDGQDESDNPDQSDDLDLLDNPNDSDYYSDDD